MVTDRIGDLLIHPPAPQPGVGCVRPCQVFSLSLLCVYPPRIAVCDPRLTATGHHDRHDLFLFSLSVVFGSVPVTVCVYTVCAYLF